MNNRQLEAERHKRELNSAKRELTAKVNQQVQSAKGRGYETQIAPQLLRLLGVKSYRKRELQNMNRLISDADRLSEYIAVIEPGTGELISGGKALERYSRYEASAIYHRVEPEEIPTEADITVKNFTEEAEKAFLDDTVYQQFINTLNRLMNGDTSVGDNDLWELLHPGIFVTPNGKTRDAKSIQHSKEHFMQDIDKYNVHDIQSAVNRLIVTEGVESVVRRLQDAGEDIINDLIIAGIGYQEQAGNAVQAVLTVLLPNETRERALAMGDISDSVDDFNGEMLE